MERSVKIDFFNFTTRRSIAEVCALFVGLKNPLKPVDRGLYGYHFSFVSSDGVTVLYTPLRSDIHVQITGAGCDSLRLYDLNVIDLLSGDDHCTRLDIAIDCIGSGFTCTDVWGLLQGGYFVSVSSDIRQIQGIMSRGSSFERINRGSVSPKATTRTSGGHTIYVGSSRSERMVRIYDKGAESETGADWLRFEVQLRSESANQFCRFLKDGGHLAELGLRLLNKQIRLMAEGQDMTTHDASRLQLHPFWAALTDASTPLKLSIPKRVKTVQSTIRYIKNAGSSIKALRQVMTDFDEFFDSVIEDSRLTAAHRSMQDDFMGGEALCFPDCIDNAA